MQLLSLIAERPFAWGVFAVYLIITSVLAYMGGKKTDTSEGFAIGSGDMNPWVAGLTLGACLASSATFVIFPGFVYKEGLAALIGFSLPLIAGLTLGLVVFSPQFQVIGARYKALTIPHWLGARYESLELRRLFSGLNVLNVAYLVLITVGCGYVMRETLGISYEASVIGIVAFVFAYTGFGGAWAHAFTNTAQGVIMLVMALAIFGSGLEHWTSGALLADLATTGMVAPGSPLFGTIGEVWVVPFVMGVALTTQPHLLTKALYVKDRRTLWQTIAIAMLSFTVFCLVLFAGAYARLDLPAGIPQDQVMARYLNQAFPWPWASSLVAVAILAAAMSTMDGLLVAISASVANDLLPGRGSVRLNRLVLGVLAVVTIAISFKPPSVVLLLGQQGVYGLVAASTGPLVAGLFLEQRLRGAGGVAAAITALAVHFGLILSGLVTNPGVAAGLALAVAVPVAVVAGRALAPLAPAPAQQPTT